MLDTVKSHSEVNARGYVLIHSDWYELADEPDMLRRNAIVLTLNPAAYVPPDRAQVVKRGFAVLEPANEVPAAYTICDCRPVDDGSFDTLEDAHNYLRERGVRRPRIGFNPIG